MNLSQVYGGLSRRQVMSVHTFNMVLYAAPLPVRLTAQKTSFAREPCVPYSMRDRSWQSRTISTAQGVGLWATVLQKRVTAEHPH